MVRTNRSRRSKIPTLVKNNIIVDNQAGSPLPKLKRDPRVSPQQVIDTDLVQEILRNAKDSKARAKAGKSFSESEMTRIGGIKNKLLREDVKTSIKNVHDDLVNGLGQNRLDNLLRAVNTMSDDTRLWLTRIFIQGRLSRIDLGQLSFASANAIYNALQVINQTQNLTRQDLAVLVNQGHLTQQANDAIIQRMDANNQISTAHLQRLVAQGTITQRQLDAIARHTDGSQQIMAKILTDIGKTTDIVDDLKQSGKKTQSEISKISETMENKEDLRRKLPSWQGKNLGNIDVGNLTLESTDVVDADGNVLMNNIPSNIVKMIKRHGNNRPALQDWYDVLRVDNDDHFDIIVNIFIHAGFEDSIPKKIVERYEQNANQAGPSGVNEDEEILPEWISGQGLRGGSLSKDKLREVLGIISNGNRSEKYLKLARNSIIRMMRKKIIPRIQGISWLQGNGLV